MGREVRRVPAGWEHPKDHRGYKPLYDRSFQQRAEEWLEDNARWESGEDPDRAKFEAEQGRRCFFWEWDSRPPDPEFYRPEWKPVERTHYQMYETVSEGTPVSPVFATAEELARYLADNGDFWWQQDERDGREHYTSKGTYEGWLRVCNGGYAPSLVIYAGKIMSGVDALTHDKNEGDKHGE